MHSFRTFSNEKSSTKSCSRNSRWQLQLYKSRTASWTLSCLNQQKTKQPEKIADHNTNGLIIRHKGTWGRTFIKERQDRRNRDVVKTKYRIKRPKIKPDPPTGRIQEWCQIQNEPASFSCTNRSFCCFLRWSCFNFSWDGTKIKSQIWNWLNIKSEINYHSSYDKM